MNSYRYFISSLAGVFPILFYGENMMSIQLRSKSVKSQGLPPIHEIYGTLEGVSIENDTNTGYIIIAYTKSNKPALFNIARELDEWEGKDVYIQVRLMTKREGG